MLNKKTTNLLAGLLILGLTAPVLAGDLDISGDYSIRHIMIKQDKSKHNQIGHSVSLNFNKEISSQLSIGLGVRTGDDRDQYIELQDTNTGRINQAYLNYKPMDGLSITAGRDLVPFTTYSAVNFDPQLSITGATGVYSQDLGAGLKLSALLGYYLPTSMISSHSSEGEKNVENPGFLAIQPTIEYSVSDMISVEGFFASYMKGKVEENGVKKEKNETINLLNLGVKATIRSVVPQVEVATIYFDHIQNINADPKENNEGYTVGLTVGAEKVNGLGDWVASVDMAETYTVIGAKTGQGFADYQDNIILQGMVAEDNRPVNSLILGLEVGLLDNLSAKVNYISAKQKDATDAETQTALIGELTVRF